LGWLGYDLGGQSSAMLKVKFFGGPRSLDILTAADARLEKSVNYGWFGWLAGPILKLMKWLYGLTHNYGVAIILLTLLVRLAVAPFNIASYKSMKAMQVIQPQVNLLKEKYKNDQATQQREMMKLMRENNANPLMGCLPMILQLPVFFALYRVLDLSLELYKAPFAFWIHDLSLKDPYYILPVLMAGVMVVQQKITPSAMDPTQAKLMLFMPLIFAGVMVAYPSGLTLYIFVSTLFGIAQQFIFIRDKKKSPTTTAVQAKA
jgi:YidC/Oxa1 family membrane protein insertase